ncbi:peroxiredoxin family protein [Methylocucumis oryzae]|uniref:Thioredoxin domain-containing protein n=1 Tax=Methylocucumis oryzae TaxID=1632867 RepID=A0A0F3IF50_9GAMM|nr:TlpA disulfide reductase family protein [Methylocucumis oryzae]KJV05450.1 hypothetical protein VZ94_18175 [Methylocucumis oryzae]
MKKIALYSILLGLLFSGLLFVNNANQAPEQVFTSITGQKIDLSAWHGKPVLITFWATDCPACLQEIPELKAVYQQQHEQGLEILAIAMYYDPPSHVVAMTQEKQLPYPVALDINGAHAQAFGTVLQIPATFLITPEGKIAKHYLGKVTRQQLIDDIQPLIQG